MKKIIFFSFITFAFNAFAQDHFTGVTTSSRVGILNVGVNPAELPNLSKKFEVNIYGLSLNFSNNVIGIKDLSSDTDIENLLFTGDRIVNAGADIEYAGPGVAMKWKEWGFGISSKGHIKFDVVDVDPKFANAILNTDDITESGTTFIKNDYNQRMSGVSWGEIGFSAGRTVFENEKHRFNAGITFKLLFPGSYANAGVDKFQGNVTTVYDPNNPNNSAAYLTTSIPVNVNFSYSGNLADRFTDVNDYTSSVFGNLGGVGSDLGVNYQLKDSDKKYKINAGMSIRNMGSLTFKDSNNSSNSYVLDIPASDPLNLNIFDGTESLVEVEQILKDQNYLKNETSNKDFKARLPTLFSMYGDFKVYHKFYITGYLQTKMGDNNENRQITAQNSFSIIPRINLGYFEAYIPFSHNEISGGNTGLGLRLGGFYMGSSSVISTLSSNTKKVDFNMGFRWAFL
ncbi:MAG: hypothetical protein IPP30_04700 [Flavobacterium sp.]|nr:hypothetical protein [Flavobacterium sp.]